MKINDYQQKALETANNTLNMEEQILDCALGLTGESGEVADLIKKWKFQGHSLNFEHIAKELGDVAWYLAVMAWFCGYDLETVLKMNVQKLKNRYPDGFEKKKSICRKKGDI